MKEELLPRRRSIEAEKGGGKASKIVVFVLVLLLLLFYRCSMLGIVERGSGNLARRVLLVS